MILEHFLCESIKVLYAEEENIIYLFNLETKTTFEIFNRTEKKVFLFASNRNFLHFGDRVLRYSDIFLYKKEPLN